MKVFECTKCKSKDIFVEEIGGAIGLFCYNCGSQIKWLNKHEAKVARKQEEKMKENVHQQIEDSM